MPGSKHQSATHGAPDAAPARLDVALPGDAIALVGPVAERPLLPAEAEILAATGSARRRQFASGRHLARLALAHLNKGQAAPVLRAGRRPVWPDGFIGSISHTGAQAAAVVCKSADLAGVGIDTEQAARVSSALARKVLTAEEIAVFGGDGLFRTLAFSAKEAGFKAINPQTGVYVGLREVAVSLGPARSFRLRYLGADAASRALERGFGHYRLLHGHVVTLFLLPHSALRQASPCAESTALANLV